MAQSIYPSFHVLRSGRENNATLFLRIFLPEAFAHVADLVTSRGKTATLLRQFFLPEELVPDVSLAIPYRKRKRHFVTAGLPSRSLAQEMSLPYLPLKTTHCYGVFVCECFFIIFVCVCVCVSGCVVEARDY